MRKNYSQEQKAEIISSYLSGKTITRLNSELGISRSTLYKWIAESTDCQQHKRKINMREFINLKHQCEQQQKMIEILQNAPCTVIAHFLSDTSTFLTHRKNIASVYFVKQ